MEHKHSPPTGNGSRDTFRSESRDQAKKANHLPGASVRAFAESRSASGRGQGRQFACKLAYRRYTGGELTYLVRGFNLQATSISDFVSAPAGAVRLED